MAKVERESLILDYAGSAVRKREQDFPRMAEYDIDDAFEATQDELFSLIDLGASIEAESLGGAMFHVALAWEHCDKMRDLAAIEAESRGEQLDPAIEQRERALKRCLFSIMNVLRAVSDEDPADFGANFLMHERFNPFRRTEATVAQFHDIAEKLIAEEA